MRRLAFAVASLLLASTGVVPSSVSATPAQRVAQAARTPALTQFRVVDHNIEHNRAALRRALQRASTIKAQAITLQEVCWWQARALRRQHPGWTVAWKQDNESGWCLRHRRGGLFAGSRKSPRGIGNVAIWTGGGRGTVSTLTFRTQRAGRHAGLACVTWTHGARQRVCSVHLLSPASRAQATIRLKQAREVHRVAAVWVRRDDLVVLGGDFNSQPKKPTLDYLYALRGRGNFREITPPRVGLVECRCTQVTADGGRTKIDYVFFSANRMAPDAARSLTITPTASDHHMLSGWAMLDASAR